MLRPLLFLLLAPMALAGAWHEDPKVWLTPELDWAFHTQPGQLTMADIEATYDPPPRADWCDASGQVYQPTLTECDDYDDDLDVWLQDFHNTSQAPFSYPPTYCGC